MDRLLKLSTTGQVVLATVVIVLGNMVAIVVIFAIRPDHDNTGIFTSLGTAAAPSLLALMAWLKGQQNSQGLVENTQVTKEIKQDVKAVKADVKDVKTDVGSVAQAATDRDARDK